jgi:hypothetical protein
VTQGGGGTATCRFTRACNLSMVAGSGLVTRIKACDSIVTVKVARTPRLVWLGLMKGSSAAGEVCLMA